MTDITDFSYYKNKLVKKITIKNGIEASFLTLGATIYSVNVLDKNGNFVDVALGFDNLDNWEKSGTYMGAYVGRYANRIVNAKFILEDKEYCLNKNDGDHCLHGGLVGFDKKIYDYKLTDNSVEFFGISADGEENFPGKLTFSVKYTIENNSIIIEYFATTNKLTVFSPTNHSYFNLNGQNNGSILDNVLQINADYYIPIKDGSPTNILLSVDKTSFDFRNFKEIGKDFNNEDVKQNGYFGYDNNFVINDNHFATVYSKFTGIKLDCFTDLKGVQLYTGNFLNNCVGKSIYKNQSGFCLETQYFPNAINYDNFSKPILRPNEKFHSKTEYHFSLIK